MLPTWKAEEKVQLLIGLRKYGSSNPELLAEEIPTKSLNDVKYALACYEIEARRAIKCDSEVLVRKAPLDEWMELIEKFPSEGKGAEDITTALKVLAFCKKSVSIDPDNINLKHFYLFLADLAMGEAPLELATETHFFLMKTVRELAYNIKNPTEEDTDYLDELEDDKEDIKKIVIKKEKVEEEDTKRDVKVGTDDFILDPVKTEDFLKIKTEIKCKEEPEDTKETIALLEHKCKRFKKN